MATMDAEQVRQAEGIASLIDPFNRIRGLMVAKALLEHCPENTNAAHVNYPFIKNFLSEENEEVLLKALALAPQQMRRAAEAEDAKRLMEFAESLLRKLERHGQENLFAPAMELALNNRSAAHIILAFPKTTVSLYAKMQAAHNGNGESHFKKVLKEMSSKGEDFAAQAMEVLENETEAKALVELAPTHDEPVSAILEMSRW